MKLSAARPLFILALVLLVQTSRLSPQQTGQAGPPPQPSYQEPSVQIFGPYVAKLNEPFEITVSLLPAPSQPTEVRMETPNVTYSTRVFKLVGGQQKTITAKVTRTNSGLVWLRASADGYATGYVMVNVDYRGRLKLSDSGKLPYESVTALTMQIVDSAGKPLPTEFPIDLQLESSNAQFVIEKPKGQQTPAANPGNVNDSPFEYAATHKVGVAAGSALTGLIKIKPSSVMGGAVHLNATLSNDNIVIAQEDFALQAQPAWWLPLLLALGGGLLHAFYKLSRAAEEEKTRPGVLAVLGASAVAGCLAYLIANFDLFGLKLDPDVLRTYPLVGFLMSYFGLDIVLSKKIPFSRKPGEGTEPKEEKPGEKTDAAVA